MSRSTRSRRTPENTTVYPPFVDDPFRGPPIKTADEDIASLNTESFLTTSLIDFILRHLLPTDLPDNVLIGTSNGQEYFTTYNALSITSKIKEEKHKAQTLRRKFQVYGLRHNRFIAINCHRSHFFVVSVDFDMEREHDPLYDVRVFDSLRKSGRKRGEKPLKTSDPGKFLMSFQEFLVKFVVFSSKHSDVLLSNPAAILEKAVYVPCPQQENHWDCGLFAVATVLHLVDNHTDITGAFTQANVTEFRSWLHHRISKEKAIRWNSVCVFFSQLRPRDLPNQVESPDSTIRNDVLGLVPMVSESADDSADDLCEVVDSRRYPENDTEDTNKEGEGEVILEDVPGNEELSLLDGIQEYDDDDEDYVDECVEDVKDEAETTANECVEDVKDKAEATEDPEELKEVGDKEFIPFFVGKKYDDIQDINEDMDAYEKKSGFRFIIQKSTAISRQYRCRSHVGCTFSAPFGRKRGTDIIILKVAITHAAHCGPVAPKPRDGRGHKKRFKGRVEQLVDHVSGLIHGDPKAKDVMKTAATVAGADLTYDQAYRAVTGTVYQRWEQEKISFEMIIPYLDKFDMLNEDSTVRYERDVDCTINRIFVCPGIMKKTLLYVRPVISLDACHLKSKWKGTLYMASVKTACEEIYPVAIAITRDNENEASWKWFLELLHSAIECLVLPHPCQRVRHKYFSFVTDRCKGLESALKKVFPDNYQWFCSVHIARNAEKAGGKRVTKYVLHLSKTFSHRYAAYLLKEIEKISRGTAKFVKDIDEEKWRGTAWQRDPGLPPRYGILSTNTSESANNMVEKARDGSWLFTVDTILSTMMERICNMRKKMEGRQGVVTHLVKALKTDWDNCAGYKVLDGENNGQEFTIIRASDSARESPKSILSTYPIIHVNVASGKTTGIHALTPWHTFGFTKNIRCRTSLTNMWKHTTITSQSMK